MVGKKVIIFHGNMFSCLFKFPFDFNLYYSAKWKRYGEMFTGKIHVACPEMTKHAEHLSPEDNGSVRKKASVAG